MITVGLAPGCPAAVHRLIAIAADGRVLDPLAWSSLAITLAFAMPIALLTVLAMWTCLRQTAGAGRGALLLAAYALHPPIVFPLAPLVLTRLPRRETGRMSMIVWTLALGVLAIALLTVAPSCADVDVPRASGVARDTLAVLSGGAGLIVALLAILQVVARPRSRQVHYALAIIGLAVLATFVVPQFDRRLTLVPALVACWWLALRAAVRLTLQSPSTAGRVATAIVLALSPVIAAAGVARGDSEPSAGVSWPALRSTLERIPRPAVIVNANARLAPWVAAWRAGLQDGAGALALVTADPTSLERAMSLRGVYALDESATLLSTSGLQIGRVISSASPDEPVLWRGVDYHRCARLSAAWIDITELGVATAITIRVSSPTARSTSAVYVSQRRPLPPGAHLWLENAGALGLTGSRLQEFDLANATDRLRFSAAARADAIDATSWLATADLVSRVLIEHEPGAEQPSTLTLATDPTRVLARLEAPPRWPNSLSACRSTVDQVVVGYPGAPLDTSFDLRLRAWAGRGWYGPENDGTGVFRWTSDPRAEVRFFVGRPESYRLKLGLMPIAGNAREALVVTANGHALVRESSEPDAWRLPGDMLQRGMNTLTLEAPVVTAPAPDRRQLGLKVRSIVLHRLAPG